MEFAYDVLARAQHASVNEAATHLGASERAYGRLGTLISTSPSREDVNKKKKSAAEAERDARAAGAAVIAAWARAPQAKNLLAGHREEYCVGLVAMLSEDSVDSQVQAATAVGALSTMSAYRAELVSRGVVSGLLHMLDRACNADAASGAVEVMLPNALAGLHNCSLVGGAIEQIASVKTATALLPLVVGPADGGAAPSRLLTRRAASVLSKCATANESIVAMLLEKAAVPPMCRMLVDEVDRRGKAGAEKAGTADKAGAEKAGAAEKARAAEMAGTAGPTDDDAETNWEEVEENEGGGLLGALLRALTACARREEGANALCEAGGLPSLVTLVSQSTDERSTTADSQTIGNAALAIAECAREKRCLAVLAALNPVPPLLAIAHRGKGQPQKNAAIALGRLAKNAHCLQALRDNHGIEILARSGVAKT